MPCGCSCLGSIQVVDIFNFFTPKITSDIYNVIVPQFSGMTITNNISSNYDGLKSALSVVLGYPGILDSDNINTIVYSLQSIVSNETGFPLVILEGLPHPYHGGEDLLVSIVVQAISVNTGLTIGPTILLILISIAIIFQLL